MVGALLKVATALALASLEVGVTATLVDLSTTSGAFLAKAILNTTDFDYIIVGGGTAGLTVARRLAESGVKKVLVLEAGRSGVNDTLVTIPQNSFSFIGTDIDWLYTTSPQRHANNQSVNESAGKVLGGGSAVNGLVWSRPSKPEFDVYQELGSLGWNWDNIYGAMRKSEHLDIPSAANTAEFGYTVNPNSHGLTGPVDASFPPFVFEQYLKFIQASVELGHNFNSDPYAGNNTGVFFTLCSENKQSVRQTSEFAYLDPILSRRNLAVFSHALVTKLDVGPSDRKQFVRARGVEVRFPDNSTATARVTATAGEVILSAGTLRTPQLLELSGIGDKIILEPLGIDVKVDLPSVGTNYEDHTITILTYQLKPGFLSFDALGYNATLKAEQEALYQVGEGWLTFAQAVLNMQPIEMILTPEEILMAETIFTKKPPSISQELFDATKTQVFSGVPQLEFLLFNSFSGGAVKLPNTSYVSMAVTHLHPLSRGTVHARTNSIDDHPIIDPNFLESEWDLFIISRATQYARNFFKTTAFQELFEKDEVFPGPTVVTDDQMEQWAKENINGGYHNAGTASLLPRSKGGVVDKNLKVYGTQNIRVADVSILPLLISAHTQTSAYAIAERAAEIILSG